MDGWIIVKARQGPRKRLGCLGLLGSLPGQPGTGPTAMNLICFTKTKLTGAWSNSNSHRSPNLFFDLENKHQSPRKVRCRVRDKTSYWSGKQAVISSEAPSHDWLVR